jgi:hypothetical protein
MGRLLRREITVSQRHDNHNFPLNALSKTDGINADSSSPLVDCNSRSALTCMSLRESGVKWGGEDRYLASSRLVPSLSGPFPSSWHFRRPDHRPVCTGFTLFSCSQDITSSFLFISPVKKKTAGQGCGINFRKEGVRLGGLAVRRR